MLSSPSNPLRLRTVALPAAVTSLLLAPFGCFSEPDPLGSGAEGVETETETSSGASVGSMPGDAPTTGQLSSDGQASSDGSNDESTGGGMGDLSDAGGTSTGEPPGPGGSSGDVIDGSMGDPAEQPCEGMSRAAFLNFDGVLIDYGTEDATANTSNRRPIVGDWASYSGSDRGAILARTQEIFAPFDICITDTRPDTAVYDMVVVTDTTDDYLGYPTWIDCGDRAGSNSVSRFSANTGGSFSAAQKGNAIASLLGIGFGLTTVNADDDVMSADPGSSYDSATFTDTCQPQAGVGDACGTGYGCAPTTHNTYATMLDLLGPSPFTP